MKDYYSILGVHRNASEAEIKRAYRKLAVIYHPDKNNDPRAQEVFIAITEAYDVIGDQARRQLYNQSIDNPFANVLVAEEQKPKHRDPAYRRKDRPVRPAPKPNTDIHELMKHYLKYFRWAGRIGLVASVLFFVDYILPYKHVEERVAEIYVVRGPKSTSHRVMVTESGRKIKLYNAQAMDFSDEPLSVVGAYTFFYSTPMWLSNVSGTDTVKLAYLYGGGLILFPMIMLVSSVLSFFYKDRIEFCFNANLVSGIVFIIFLILV